MTRDLVTLGGAGAAGAPAAGAAETAAERPWRSLERRAEDAAAGTAAERLPERVRPELPPGADLPPDGVTRRTVLGLMGASLALAGTTACRRPVEEIVPYVRQPEEVVPGVPRHFATTLPLGASVLGVVVESHEGRPTKVEGNPDHPASGGAASVWAQASILDLYDPDRRRGVTRRTEPDAAPATATWADFAAWWQERGEALAEGGGRGLAIVAGASTSPTLERLAGDLAARFPAARWIVHEPAGDLAIHEGLGGAGGAATLPVYDLSRARRVLALDSDLLHTESDAVANARGLAAARRAGAAAGGDAALRLYVVEPVPTSTGAVADHRLRLPAGQIAAFAAAVAEGLGVAAPSAPARQERPAVEPGAAEEAGPAVEADDAAAATGEAAVPPAGPAVSTGPGGPAATAAGAEPLAPELRRRAALIAADLASAPGAALVAAGRRQPAEVHALVRAINGRLGAPVAYRPVPRLAAVGRGADGSPADLASLAAAIEAAEIDTLVVLGGDPAYSAPGDLALAERLASVPHRVVVAHDENRTAEGAEWVLPLAHPFEAWGDARSADGTLSPIQPLIEPLFGGRSEIEVVGLLASGEERPGYELVRETWQRQGLAGGDFERGWRRALHAGVAAQGTEPGNGEGAARPEGRPLDEGERASGGEEGVGAAAAMAAGSADAGGEEREPRDRAAGPPAAPGAAQPPAEAGSVEPFAARTVDDDTAVDGAVGLEEVAAEEADPADPFAADSVAADGAAAAPAGRASFEPPPWRDLELVFLVSPAVLDGRFAGNAWLQELPDPMTKQVWGNAALIAPATAAELGLGDGDEVLLTAGGRRLLAPVAVQPGQAERTVALALGYGRTAVGRAGRGVGVDAYRLRGSASPWIDRVAVQRTGRRHQLTRTQEHWEIEGRDLTRFAAIGAAAGGAPGSPRMTSHREVSHHAGEPGAAADGDTNGADHGAGSERVAAAGEHEAVQLWEPPPLGGQYQWGMAIDLATCVGCNACVVACQSENNIPVVGPEQVRKGREMHWLRVDRYYAGPPEEPRFAFQPVPCMHCENAPCEQVCPVAATVHDAEGLNGMTYNRCIGTRYCSNNCPYKVRRFNFFNYTNETPEIVELAMNPDVTVRSRGVMEKCSYCVQRINEGKMRAKLAGRALADGEVKTACQQTCPADAIVFGDVADPETRVSAWKREGRNYVLLGELNNRPRTSYLARWVNLHPEWEERA